MGLMDRYLGRKSHGTLFLCKTAARLLYAQKWKGSVEEWLVKMVEHSEMGKLASFEPRKTIFTFLADWKPLIDFFA